MKEPKTIQSLIQTVLEAVGAPQATVTYAYQRSLATRFAENAITQNMGGEEEYLRLVVAYGHCHGSSISNRLDEQSIRDLVQRAETIARSVPEDPEYMPPLGPQSYPELPRHYFDDVARLRPRDLAGTIGRTVETAKAADFRASGLFAADFGTRAAGTSEGLFVCDRGSIAEYSTTLHGQAGSGYCGQQRESAVGLEREEITLGALQTARSAQNPRPIEPGDYTVVFEPQAVSDLLEFLFWDMDARDADEGTTVFTGSVGRRLFSDKVRLSTRLDDPELPARPFGQDGLPVRETTWIEGGEVKRLRHDRYWAEQKGVDPDPGLYPLFMDGEDRSIEDLIALCGRGLLVKRLWYIRYVDRRELLLTGMTRDGLFLIENGAVGAPVQNLRFNESPVVFLSNIVALSRPRRVGQLKVPGVLSETFTFNSTTESV